MDCRPHTPPVHLHRGKPLPHAWGLQRIAARRKVHCVLLWPAALTVHIYHGKDRVKEAEQLARYACVLTTYTTLGMDAPVQPEKQAMAERQPNALAPGGCHQSNQPGYSSPEKQGAVLQHVPLVQAGFVDAKRLGS